MHNKLLEIIEKKKEDLILQKQQLSQQKLKEKIKISEEENTFKKNISDREGVVLIAEIKFASPTNPSLGSKEELLERAKQYKEAGANAISIITEPHFFKGDISFVSQVKSEINLPVLQKDFVIDERQIYQAKEIGSDALLLIARLLDVETLKSFVEICKDLGIEPVVEINSEDDLEKAIATDTNIIAVNARDLETFEISVKKACALMKKIPKTFIKLGFSGINSRNEVEQYKNAGAKGVLIGTSLMKTNNISQFIKDLRVLSGVTPVRRSSLTSFSPGARRGAPTPTTRINGVKVKICGVRSIENAKAAIAAGADFLGFNFVPTSKRFIDPKEAKEIIDAIKGKTKTVGVFQNASLDEVNKISEILDLDFVQLHGEEDAEYMKKIKKPIIKKVNHESRIMNHGGTYLILDRDVQGKGEMVDLEKAAEISQEFPTFFSGGLTPKNVSNVIKKVKPFAVDVAGGIETNGIIDIEKMKTFIRNAKEVML